MKENHSVDLKNRTVSMICFIWDYVEIRFDDDFIIRVADPNSASFSSPSSDHLGFIELIGKKNVIVMESPACVRLDFDDGSYVEFDLKYSDTSFEGEKVQYATEERGVLTVW